MLVTIVRHGESIDNLKQKWSGNHDCNLTNWGYLQATLAGQYLKNDKFTHIFCSDLKRAKLTCEAIVKEHEFNISTQEVFDNIHYHKELREQDFGDIDGMEPHLPKVREITEKMRDMNLSWAERFQLKFPNGESKQDLYLRCSSIWKLILSNIINNKIQPLSDNPTHILIVCHGLTINQLIPAIADHPYSKSDATSRASLSGIRSDNTCIWRIQLGQGPFRLLLRNCTEHYNKLPLKRSINASSPYDPTQTSITSFLSNSL
ncbi:phosphoglycerate mutase-like protein, partial [Neoconidiobolus thromboides FSU 785]